MQPRASYSTTLNNAFRLAYEYYELQQFDIALDICEVLIKYETNSIELLRFASDIAYRLKDLNLALKYAEKIIQIAPRNIDAIYSIGILYFEMNQYEKAEKAFKEVILDNPKNNFAKLNLAKTLQKQGNIKQAYNLLKDALAQNPISYITINELGMLKYENNEFAKAEDYFRNSLEINSDQPNIYELYYKVLVKNGKSIKDLKPINKAFDIKNTAIYLLKADMLLGGGELIASIESYNQAARLDYERLDVLIKKLNAEFLLKPLNEWGNFLTFPINKINLKPLWHYCLLKAISSINEENYFEAGINISLFEGAKDNITTLLQDKSDYIFDNLHYMNLYYAITSNICNNATSFSKKPQQPANTELLIIGDIYSLTFAKNRFTLDKQHYQTTHYWIRSEILEHITRTPKLFDIILKSISFDGKNIVVTLFNEWNVDLSKNSFKIYTQMVLDKIKKKFSKFNIIIIGISHLSYQNLEQKFFLEFNRIVKQECEQRSIKFVDILEKAKQNPSIYLMDGKYINQNCFIEVIKEHLI